MADLEDWERTTRNEKVTVGEVAAEAIWRTEAGDGERLYSRGSLSST